jgi:hypothetical protein
MIDGKLFVEKRKRENVLEATVTVHTRAAKNKVSPVEFVM